MSTNCINCGSGQRDGHDLLCSTCRAGEHNRSQCPRWIAFVNEVTGDETWKTLALQEFFGYCLFGNNDRSRHLVIYGEPRTGKTVALNTLRRLTGDGMLGESAPRSLPSFLDWNQKPTFGSQDAEEQTIVIEFTHAIREDEMDRELDDKLANEAEGIMAWARIGYNRLEAANGFTDSDHTAPRLNDKQLIALLNLWMVSDPWPNSAEDHDTLLGLMNAEATERGYDDWVVAYHEMERTRPGRLGSPQRAIVDRKLTERANRSQA